MSVEELMQTRYKLEIRYPHYPFDGDILLVGGDGELFHETEGYCASVYKIMEADAKKSECFREMEWYEDREESEMPKFVKIQNSLTGLFQDCKKVKAYLLFANVVEFDDGEEGHISFWLPSTLEEYDSFIKLKKNDNRKQ